MIQRYTSGTWINTQHDATNRVFDFCPSYDSINNKQLLYWEERFYEREYDDFVPDDKDNKLEELSKLKNVDIDEIQIDPIPQAESVPSVEEPVKKDFQPDYPSWMLRLRKQGKVIKLYDSCYSKFQNLPFWSHCSHCFQIRFY